MNNILEYLEESAERFPDKTAIADQNQKFTFRELLTRVRQLAAEIHRSVGSEGRAIAAVVNRSADTAIAFLGIAASGNYYVALDPAAPVEKIRSILEDSEPAAMVGRTENRALAENCGRELPFLKLEQLPEEEYCVDFLQTREDTPLYMVYTSGSTGKPKGILKSHGAYIHYIEAFQKQFAISSDTVIGNQTPFFFDASAKDLYLSLKIGATLEILPTELFSFPMQLVQYMNDRRVSYISWVPSALALVSQLHTFREILPRYLRYVFFVGEVFPMKQLNRWRKALPDLQYVNLYGSSEIAGICCYYQVEKPFPDDAVLPIGKSLPGCQVFLVQDGTIVREKNTVGEICISGKSLALCYFHDEEKTRNSFLFADTPTEQGQRCFLTGDLAYYDEEDNLVFVSRKDFQIKHMGHRIELGEIETVANALEGVQRVCCLYQEKKNKIVLFCQLAQGETLTRQELSAMLKERLSDYMVPNKIVIQDNLPLNPNGKIDRQKLREQL